MWKVHLVNLFFTSIISIVWVYLIDKEIARKKKH
jgi:hypothetical protein